jgi:hypothetical protein
MLDQGELALLVYIQRGHEFLGLLDTQLTMGRNQIMATQMDDDLLDVEEGQAGLLALPHLESDLVEDLVIGLIQNDNEIIGLLDLTVLRRVHGNLVDIAGKGGQLRPDPILKLIDDYCTITYSTAFILLIHEDIESTTVSLGQGENLIGRNIAIGCDIVAAFVENIEDGLTRTD